MQGHAATSLAVGVQEKVERRIDPRSAEGFLDDVALPILVEAVPHVLCRAAAANAEIGAERPLALGRGRLDGDEMSAPAVALDRYGLTGKA